MPMDKKGEEHIKLIKDHLCDDLNPESCKKLLELLKDDTENRIYFDTVRKTVKLCMPEPYPK